jgi:hypothetical protein
LEPVALQFPRRTQMEIRGDILHLGRLLSLQGGRLALAATLCLLFLHTFRPLLGLKLPPQLVRQTMVRVAVALQREAMACLALSAAAAVRQERITPLRAEPVALGSGIGQELQPRLPTAPLAGLLAAQPAGTEQPGQMVTLPLFLVVAVEAQAAAALTPEARAALAVHPVAVEAQAALAPTHPEIPARAVMVACT